MMFLTGCFTTPPYQPPQYRVEGSLYEESPPTPVVVIESGTGAEPPGVIIDPVKIEPEKAIGYENLPESITRLFDDNPLDLSLVDMVIETFANNRDIRIESYNLRIAEYEIPVSKGIYDLLVRSGLRYDRIEEDGIDNNTVTFDDSASARSRMADVSLTQLLPTGGSLTLAYGVVREWIGSFLTPAEFKEHTHRSLLEYRQPLLRGLGPSITEAGIEIAQLEQRGSAADFQATIERTLADALKNYWELIGAIEEYKVRLISYSAACDLLRINTVKYDVGTVPLVDVLQAEAAAETRREELIRARQDVRDLEDQLKKRIFLQPDIPTWERQIRPSQPFAWREIEVALEKAVETAMAERSELRRADVNIGQGNVNLRVAKDDIKPSLDFVGSVDTNATNGDFDGGFQDHRTGRYTNWSLELDFSYPLQNRSARYRMRQAEMIVEQAREIRSEVVDRITLEVRLAMRALRTARERITVTGTTVRSEQEKLRSEQKRYEVGVSTAYQVLEFQEDLADAQSTHLSAVVDYNVALIELERATATILDSYGVELADADLEPAVEEPAFDVGLD
jgi:outer membrane protein